jgi:type IV secretion system protein VirB8
MSSMTGEAASEPRKVDPAYFEDGVKWETAVYRSVLISRNAWRTVSLLLGAALIVALGTLYALVPLKSLEVVTLLVDKTTGHVEIARPLEPQGEMTQRESVTRANIVRYIRSRETYDPRGLRDNFELASLLSSGAASKDLAGEFSESNPRNPMKLYGPDTAIRIVIKSVIFLNDRTAAVRFQSLRKSDREEVRTDWVANVRFRYTTEPMRNEWRWDNPLGFQVLEYRRDQESANTRAETQP